MIQISPANSKLFFSKNDPHDIRIGELATPTNYEAVPHNSISLIGYPDDEGIQLNGGRIGSAKAPDVVREYLYKMTPGPSKLSLFDIGNLNTESMTLAERHQVAQNISYELQKKTIRTISVGGGHDYGYSDTSAFVKAHMSSGPKPVVLNFDAHLDVRPTTKGFNSGTPFYRLLEEFSGEFEFAEIGIQPQCNSKHHKDWALLHKTQIFELPQIIQEGGLSSLLKHSFFKNFKHETPVFISFDIDGLKSSEAPGCSQSWTTGLNLEDYLVFFNQLRKQCNIRGLGIYEVSPPLDIQNLTSKAAALIIYHFLFGEPQT